MWPEARRTAATQRRCLHRRQGDHFDQSTARAVTDVDGGAHTDIDLKLGMAVELDASGVVVSGGRLVAGTHMIRIASTLAGAVDEMGSDALTVMGQTVRVAASTQFGDAQPSSQASLKPSDVADVGGAFRPKRGWHKTWR